MIEVKKKIIEGSEYSVTQMTARHALQTQAKLIKMFGSSMGDALVAFAHTGSEDYAMAKALSTFAMQLDEKTFDKMVFELLVGVRKEGMELTDSIIQLEFAGKLNEMFLVIWFVLEANYSDFLAESGIITLLREKGKKEKEISQASLKTSMTQ